MSDGKYVWRGGWVRQVKGEREGFHLWPVGCLRDGLHDDREPVVSRAEVDAAHRAYFDGEPSPPGTADYACMEQAIRAALLARAAIAKAKGEA